MQKSGRVSVGKASHKSIFASKHSLGGTTLIFMITATELIQKNINNGTFLSYINTWEFQQIMRLNVTKIKL